MYGSVKITIVFLYLSTNCIWAGVGISLAYILEFIADAAMNHVDGRIMVIVLLLNFYLIFDTVFEFFSSHNERASYLDFLNEWMRGFLAFKWKRLLMSTVDKNIVDLS